MAEIVPCITVETPDEYKLSIERLSGFATHVHVDVSDGEFTERILLGVGQLYWPANWTVDIHAMVARPSEYVQSLVELKPRLIIFHAEVEEDLTPTIQLIQSQGIKAGLALVRPTVPKNIANLIQLADHAMIFSGELGEYGGKAHLIQLEKVRLIRRIKPNIEIGWDGGANAENAFSLSQGGIDIINTGGAISKSDDPEAVFRKMTAEINRQSVL